MPGGGQEEPVALQAAAEGGPGSGQEGHLLCIRVPGGHDKRKINLISSFSPPSVQVGIILGDEADEREGVSK